MEGICCGCRREAADVTDNKCLIVIRLTIDELNNYFWTVLNHEIKKKYCLKYYLSLTDVEFTEYFTIHSSLITGYGVREVF